MIAISVGIAELHGRAVADKLVRLGFIPLVLAIVLTVFVLQLPTDPGMYEPAKDAFPIIVGQGWRMMAAGIIAYRSEEHTSELQSLMRTSYADFCWQKKTQNFN